MSSIEISPLERQKRLLILDDDVDVGKTIGVVARRAGFAVRVCQGANEFFETLAAWEPTHIALDLVMPAMDGIEVLRNLAEKNCRAGIIVTSGIGEKVLESARRASSSRGLNVIGILPKPFSGQALRDLLQVREEIRPVVDAPERAETAIFVDAEDLETAIQEDQFVLHYQPKVGATDRHVFGMEALVRWQHPSLGLLFPDSFIPLAEQCGKIDAMTEKVIGIGLEWLRRVRELGGDVALEFNVSAKSIADIAFADVLEERCRITGVPTESVVIEVTETSKLRNINDASDILSRLRIKGFRLAIDDYGIGYSSMRQLADLPFTEVKIDKSFVSSIIHSSERRLMVESTVRLADRLGMATVAEGVEDADTLQVLSDRAFA